MLEKTREVSKFLDKTEMPNVVKQQIVLGVAFGANPDSIIKGAVSSLSTIETAKAEAKTPQRTDKPRDYTETESAIHDMLTESTGTNILDSGGAYGRHWQKNREIRDFRKTPQIDVTVWKDGQIDTSINIFHYLTAFLEIDETAKQLQKEFDEFVNLPENENTGYLALMEDFAEKIEDYGFTAEKASEEANDDLIVKSPMNENIELSKVRVLGSHLQGNINAMHSLVLGSYVSVTALLATITFQTMDLRVMIVGMSLTAIGWLFGLLFYVKKYQKRNLTYIDELLKKIENGETLPSLIELEKLLHKR